MSPTPNRTVVVLYSMKGGSGTTVTAAIVALQTQTDTIIIDLAGDMADVLGRNTSPPTFDDYLLDPNLSDLSLDDLLITIDGSTRLLPASRAIDLIAASPSQRRSFDEWLDRPRGTIIIDEGARVPHFSLVESADRVLAVTRPCYLSLMKAARSGYRPDGVVVVREPHRALGPSDIERSFNAPIVGTVDHDPEIARLVDAGLLPGRADRLRAGLSRITESPAPMPSALDRWRAADPRRHSPDVDYGMSWHSSTHPERRWRVSWNTGSGALYAIDDAEQHIIDLAHFDTQPTADVALAEWASLHRDASGLDALRQRFGNALGPDGPSVA